jgi:hypothetical protein
LLEVDVRCGNPIDVGFVIGRVPPRDHPSCGHRFGASDHADFQAFDQLLSGQIETHQQCATTMQRETHVRGSRRDHAMSWSDGIVVHCGQ